MAMTSDAAAVAWQPVLRFPANETGTDYVVGDIHGAYDLVWAAMLAAKFDPTCDRLFVVGDMVDRGEESIRALRFLRLPYVHAVRGNHEDVWIDLYDNAANDNTDGSPNEDMVRAVGNAMRIGNKWWFAADPAQRNALVAEFRRLPLAIEIETHRGLVGLVHADVPDGLSWPVFVDRLEAGDEKVVEKALGSRHRINRGNEAGVPGIGRVFVGHTPQWTGPLRLGNVYAVDTGAIFGLTSNGEEPGHLTLASLTCATASLTKAAENLRASGLVDLRDEEALARAPFGDYARQR